MGGTRPPACNGTTNTSADFCVSGEDMVVRADMNIIEWFTVNISGQVMNQCNTPAKNVTLRLLRVCGDRTREVARTRTDDNGCYCFSFRTTDCHACYRIVAPGADMGQGGCSQECHHHCRRGAQDSAQDSEDC